MMVRLIQEMQMGVKFRVLVSAAVLALASVSSFSVPQAQAVNLAEALPDVADLADKLLPSVVEISVQSKSPDAAPGASPLDSNPFKDFFDEFLKRKQQQGQTAPDNKQQPDAPKNDNGGDNKGGDKKDNGQGNNDAQPDDNNLVNSMGSGFIIDPKGYIITNNHVIADAVNIQVHLQDGTLLKAELVGHDPKTDIAVIKVKPDKDLPAVGFADSDKARIGQWVMAIGNPFGLGGSVSLGIISARNRDINAGPYDDYIQTDAAINKGNSGGPLFNLDGAVVGVNTAIFSPSGGSVGIGFSVPSNEVKSVSDQLIKFGETRRGWLGVKLQTMTPDVAESMGMAKPRGALVADVTADGPSDKAGLKAGDVIVTFDGRTIEDTRKLRRVVASTEVGKEVGVVVLREGKEQEIKVTLGRLEEGEKLAAAATKPDAKDDPQKPAAATASVLGLGLSDLDEAARSKFKVGDKVKGALITDVEKNSDAEAKGVTVGDVIIEAGGKAVAGAQDVVAAAAAAEKDKRNTLLLFLAHGGEANDTRFVAVKLKK
jgi:serine protease Do